MATLRDLLAAGSLRSDGFANEAAQIVGRDPSLIPALMEVLSADDPAARGHAADALEKVARRHPKAVARHLDSLAAQAKGDDVAMVRWHLAMALGHFSTLPGMAARVMPTLLELLQDPSAFVRSLAITGLTLAALRLPSKASAAVSAIAPLRLDSSRAVAKRAATALRALTDPDFRLPSSWIKVQVP